MKLGDACENSCAYQVQCFGLRSGNVKALLGKFIIMEIRLILIMVSTGQMQSDVLINEDFSSYQPGSNLTDSAIWHGDELYVGPSHFFGSNATMSGYVVNEVTDTTYYKLGVPFRHDRIYEFSVDAYIDHENDFISSTGIFLGDHTGKDILGFIYYRFNAYWGFRNYAPPGPFPFSSDFHLGYVQARNKVVSLRFVLDTRDFSLKARMLGGNNEISESPTFYFDPDRLHQIGTLTIINEYDLGFPRKNSASAEFDNIILTETLESVAPVTVFGDDFEGAYPGLWHVGKDGGAGDFGWAWPTSYAHAYSNPMGQPFLYPDDLHVYMERRNIDLSGYSSATLKFNYIVDTEEDHDFFTINVLDQSGTWHEMLRLSGENPVSWKIGEIDFTRFCGQSGLSVQFRFDSNDSISGLPYQGVYIDNISLVAVKGASPHQGDDAGNPITVEGRVHYMGKNDRPISGIEIILLQGGLEQRTTTDAEGHYLMEALSGHPMEIRAEINGVAQPNQGIDVADLVMLRRHILNRERLTTPMEWVASDVNGDRSVDVADLEQMRQIILNRDAFFRDNQGNTLPTWSLFNTGFSLINASQSIVESPNYREYHYDEVTSSITAADFIVVKRGDNNGDWNPDEGN